MCRYVLVHFNVRIFPLLETDIIHIDLSPIFFFPIKIPMSSQQRLSLWEKELWQPYQWEGEEWEGASISTKPRENGLGYRC